MTDFIKLTAKQEKFCQNIISGMNQSDAYRDAYNAEKMTPKQIWEKASVLAASEKVSERIKQLKKPIDDKIRADYGKIIGELSEIAFSKDKKDNDRLKALELLGKTIAMFTDKQEVEHSGEMGVIRLPMKLPEGAPVQIRFGESVELETDGE